MAIYDPRDWNWGAVGNVLFGGDPEDVALPAEVEAARAARAGLVAQLSGDPTQARLARQAVQQDVQAQRDALADALASRAAGARGLAALAAQRQAMAATAQGQARLGAQAAAGLTRAQMEAEERRRRLLAQLLGQQEAVGFAAQQFREKQAGTGLLPALLAGGGAALGGVVGGVEGAQVGSGLGAGIGTGISRSV